MINQFVLLFFDISQIIETGFQKREFIPNLYHIFMYILVIF